MMRLRILCLASISILGFIGGCRPLHHVVEPVPPGISYLSREAWEARDPVLPMQEHEPSRITIHHTATRQDTTRSLRDKLRALQEFSQSESPLADGRIKQPWADVPYHFYVDVYGAVAEARSLQYAGDSNTPYDPSGHILVVFEGNFEEETLSALQRRTLDRLVVHLAEQFGVPPEDIAAHKDFADTRCPGVNLYAELPRLRDLVKP